MSAKRKQPPDLIILRKKEDWIIFFILSCFYDLLFSFFVLLLQISLFQHIKENLIFNELTDEQKKLKLNLNEHTYTVLVHRLFFVFLLLLVCGAIFAMENFILVLYPGLYDWEKFSTCFDYKKNIFFKTKITILFMWNRARRFFVMFLFFFFSFFIHFC